MIAFAPGAAHAQSTVPPTPEQFKAMQTPSSPAALMTAPGASLITPATGVPNPPAGFTGSKMVMTQRVWQDYVKYLRNDVAIGFGLFMITVDGQHSDVMPCKNYTCQINPVTRMTALDQCRAKSNSQRCIVFAEGRDIKYAYQVLP
jgi:hypothetical protein